MAKDLYHGTVKEVLENDSWVITHDNNYRLETRLLKDPLTIDLGAEKLIVAEKGKEKIAVEVKSYLNESLIYDFHGILGQLLTYKENLDIQEPDRILFLAIPIAVWKRMQEQPIIEYMLNKYQLNFFIFEPEFKQIIEWKKHQN